MKTFLVVTLFVAFIGATAAEDNLKELLRTLLKAAEKTEDNELELLQREQEKADDEYVAETLYRLTRGIIYQCGDSDECKNKLGFKKGNEANYRCGVKEKNGALEYPNCDSRLINLGCKATCGKYRGTCTCKDFTRIDTDTGNEIMKRNLGEDETKRKLLAAFKKMLENL